MKVVIKCADCGKPLHARHKCKESREALTKLRDKKIKVMLNTPASHTGRRNKQILEIQELNRQIKTKQKHEVS